MMKENKFDWFLQKYEYYSPAIIKGTIKFAYMQKKLRTFGAQIPPVDNFFFRVDTPYYWVLLHF